MYVSVFLCWFELDLEFKVKKLFLIQIFTIL